MTDLNNSYVVQIFHRMNRYVAVDSSGSERAWGNASKYTGKTPRELAEYLFHSDEIGSVGCGIGQCLAVVEIITGSSSSPVVSESIAAAAHVMSRDVVAVLDRHRSIACETNPLLAHCLERVIGDLRRSMNELNQIAILSKAPECEAV